MARLKKHNSILGSIVQLVILLIPITLVAGFVWSQSNYIKVTNMTYELETIPRQYTGYKIVHISDIDNQYVNIVNKIKKEEPNMIFISGGFADKEGKTHDSIRVMNELCEIAPVYYTLQPDDIQYELEIAESTSAIYLNTDSFTLPVVEKSVVDYINENCDAGVIKEIEKETEDSKEYVEYIANMLQEDKDKLIQICGINGNKESIYDNLDDIYSTETVTSNCRILLLGNIGIAESLKDTGIDLVLSGGTYGLNKQNNFSNGINMIDNYVLAINSGLCKDIPNTKRFMNYAEIQVITLSDGQIYKRNPLERFIEIFVKDTGTIFDNDGGFKIVRKYAEKQE